ncbi:hypothetical protein EG68_06816 [Paragonimus skrjabini miyazakii]|uniref:Sec1 family domain-containing protein 1 n=1 Tax=Paragonimus skrjabini miyazakii TaxID=59628 RepID=A0A8S9YNC2_9TREM|nr:hypothetical protein EG68_06816 [Paragonimus skrjabini miyazakii]
MLNFNSPPTANDVPQWKILIYDQLGRDIISPLLSVKDLRALGVTLHLLIDSPREHIPDVPAVYFIFPSKENITTVCKDFELARYESYYLNFISPVSRECLELIAQTALSEDCVQQIAKVFDQYTNFVCLDDDLLIFRPVVSHQCPSYYSLYRSRASDADIESIVDATVDGLFSVFATLGSVPIIRCPRGGASEMIASRLEAKLRDSLRDSRNSLFANSDTTRGFGTDGRFPRTIVTAEATRETQLSANAFSNLFQRPLLILLDRSLDLATPLHHELTYQSIVHDVFNIRLNRVQVDLALAKEVIPTNVGDTHGVSKPKVPTSGKPSKLEQYDLNTMNDRLWREFKGAAFSDVAEAIREEVCTLKEYEKRMSELKTSMGLSGDLGSADESTLTLLDDNTMRLTNAVSSLPQLMERKRFLDMHTNIATCLANVITQRQLHVFAEEEDKLFSKQTATDSNIAELIKNPTIGSPEDKLRLLVFVSLLKSGSLLCTSGGSVSGSGVGAAGTVGSTGVSSGTEYCLNDSEVSQFKSWLKEACPDLDLSAMEYVQHLRRLSKMSQVSDQVSSVGGMRVNSSKSMLNKLVSHGSAIFLTGMRHLIGQKSYLPFTRIVSQLMENKGGSEVDDYRYFDPKLHRRQNTMKGGVYDHLIFYIIITQKYRDVPRFKHPFYEAFVFVVGGGSYVEYHDLLEWARANSEGGGGGATGPSLSVNGTNSMATDVSSAGSTGHVTVSGFGLNAKRIVYGCTELVSPNEFLEQVGSCQNMSKVFDCSPKSAVNSDVSFTQHRPPTVRSILPVTDGSSLSLSLEALIEVFTHSI